MVFALETYCPATGRLFRRPHRGGGRRHRRGAEGDQPVSGRGTADLRQILKPRGGNLGKRHRTAEAAKPDLANDDIGEETRLALWRSQLEIRHVEKRAHDLFLQNLVKGTVHLSLGQEAIAAGFAVAMEKGDYSFCTYRGHAHTLARGAPMSGVLGELMARECGLLNGKGGSMHLTSVEHGAMGSYAIIGAHLPIAMGAAWSAQYRGTEQVSVCFFGDGTTNIGAFHEALNMAQVWKLPVIFVCENNLYMEYTPIGDVTAVEHPAADRASAYGMESIIVDGNDADAVYRVAQTAYAKARSGGGPSLIEAKTYRHSGHSRGRPGHLPAGRRSQGMARPGPDPGLPAKAARFRLRGSRDRRHRRRRAGGGRRGDGDGQGLAPAAAGNPRDRGL
ncbi:Acetoin:2,6-dichlorophenolindophenol oxidoreductase subunit alpha, partial [Geodia barretti]